MMECIILKWSLTKCLALSILLELFLVVHEMENLTFLLISHKISIGFLSILM